MTAVLKQTAPVMAPHWKLSTREYHRMIAAGILQQGDRVELIEGELIDMAPIGYRHSGLSNALVELLGFPTRGRATTSVQNPIWLDQHTEPRPDFALLRYQADRYQSRQANATDVLLLVEIADASLRYDRKVKAPLYALHGIPEYWIVDLPGRKIAVHREPDPVASRYAAMDEVSSGTLVPAAFPDVVIRLDDLLG